jgi:hypothetical protein
MSRKAEKNPICTRCGSEITGALGFAEMYGLYPKGLCLRCLDDSFDCPRCNRKLPKSENRGSYCRECRSEYNRAYAARRRGLA